MILYAIVTEVTTAHAVRWTRPTRPFLLMIFADGTHVSIILTLLNNF